MSDLLTRLPRRIGIIAGATMIAPTNILKVARVGRPIDPAFDPSAPQFAKLLITYSHSRDPADLALVPVHRDATPTLWALRDLTPGEYGYIRRLPEGYAQYEAAFSLGCHGVEVPGAQPLLATTTKIYKDVTMADENWLVDCRALVRGMAFVEELGALVIQRTRWVDGSTASPFVLLGTLAV